MAAALSQHSKGLEPAMITLFCNENFQESLPHLSPLMSLALALYPQYIIVVTAQRQTSLNYFLEWPHYMWSEGILMEMAPQDMSSPKDHSLATYASLSFALEIHLLSLSHMVPRFVV